MSINSSKKTAYEPPQITSTMILDNQLIIDTNIEDIKKVRDRLLAPRDTSSALIMDRFKSKYDFDLFARKRQTHSAALGDFSEATTTVLLLNSWGVSDNIIVKWIHPDTGAASKRGIDIIAFSDDDTLDGIRGIFIFEIKGASTKNSLDQQIKLIEKFVSRKVGEETQPELLELAALFSRTGANFSDEQLLYLIEEKPELYLGGALITDEMFRDSADEKFRNSGKINTFIKKIRQLTINPLSALIILYSKNINEEVNRFNNEV